LTQSRYLSAALLFAIASPLFGSPLSQAAEPATAPEVSVEQPGEMDLAQALQLAVRNNPGLRAALELEVQARNQRDSLFMLLTPTFNLGWQYRVNDREISFNPADSFGGDALASTFEPLYGNLGYIFGEMFGAGWVDDQDCAQLAQINGYADCDELSQAFLDGADLSPPSSADDGADSEPVVVQQKSQQIVNLSASWPINPRSIPMGRASNNELRAARADVQQQRDAVMLGVVRAYAATWQAQEALHLYGARLEAAEARLRDAQSLQGAGMLTREGQLQAQLLLERSRRAQQEGRAQLRSARRGLKLAIGLPELQIPELTAIPSLEIERFNPEDLRSQASELRPEAQAAESRTRATRELQVDAALQFLPQFSVTGNLSYTDRASGFDNRRNSWWIGLGVNLPLWDGGIRVKNARDAASRRRQAKARLEMLRQQIDAEVEGAWDRFQSRSESLAVAELELELAAELNTAVKLRFQLGQATQSELLEAETQREGANFALLQARAARELAAAELLASAGRIGTLQP
tara:strand:+ start:48 stop:1616 length:1569 start_codon:yes stop_codon:yes gene_type:complete